MKKALWIVPSAAVFLIAAAITISTYQFNTYQPSMVTQAPRPGNLAFFQESYGACRDHFRAQAKRVQERYANVEIASLPTDSQRDPELTTDYCYIPAQQRPERLLILTSAVHGVEGYVGSAIQQMVMEQIVPVTDLATIGIFLIHGVNPYGFQFNRRVSESNVDLNRNCMVDPAGFQTVNRGYGDLDPMLNPAGPVDPDSIGNLGFQLTAMARIVQHSMPTLRQAVLQGQYQRPKGIYFGGRQLEPAIAAVSGPITEKARAYPTVFLIDLHTGYGERGTLHLFPSVLDDPGKRAEVERIFSGLRIDWADQDDFYTITGDFATYVGQILPEKNYLTMTFEFGTLDSQVTLGAITSLHNVILENQGAHFGYDSPRAEAAIKQRFLEGYYPSSAPWRSKAIEDARRVIVQAIMGYGQTGA